MTTPELYTDGKTLLFRATRRPTPPIGGRKVTSLGPRQVQWCTENLTGFAWPKVQRLTERQKGGA